MSTLSVGDQVRYSGYVWTVRDIVRPGQVIIIRSSGIDPEDKVYGVTVLTANPLLERISRHLCGGCMQHFWSQDDYLCSTCRAKGES